MEGENFNQDNPQPDQGGMPPAPDEPQGGMPKQDQPFNPPPSSQPAGTPQWHEPSESFNVQPESPQSPSGVQDDNFQSPPISEEPSQNNFSGEPRKLGQLLSDGLDIFKKNFKTFALLVSVIYLPFLIVGYIFSYVWIENINNQFSQSMSISDPEKFYQQYNAFFEKIFSPISIVIFVIFIVVAILISILISVSSIIAAVKAVKGEEIKIIDCYKEGWHKLGSFALIGILTGLAVLGGFILLIIPGVIFAIWFYFAEYNLIVDDIRGTKALSLSKKIVQGYWWKVAGNIFVAGLLVGIAGLILSLPFNLLSELGIPFISIIPSLIEQILGIFIIIFSVLLFFDLKATKKQV